MEFQNPSNGESEDNGDHLDPTHSHFDCFADDFDSACSTPFVSAPSSPGRGGSHVPVSAFYFSAPSSPMHYMLSSTAFSSPSSPSDPSASSFEFEFSSRFPASAASAAAGSMSSADELFLNGQIRPMKLSTHLQRPQNLAPLNDTDAEDEDGRNRPEMQEIAGSRGRDLKLRSRSIHRKTRSLSPLRNAPFNWRFAGGTRKETEDIGAANDPDLKQAESEMETPSVSASSSRCSSTSSSSSSSSSGRKRWLFLKDLLHRSTSEGSSKTKEKFWHHLSFAVPKERPKRPPAAAIPIPPQAESDPEKKKPAVSASTKTETSKKPRLPRSPLPPP